MKIVKGIFILTIMCLAACKKNAPNYSHGVLLGFDTINCKDKLIMRLDTSIFGYLATGYYSDCTDYMVRNYPSTFHVDTNSIFPIYVLLNYTTSRDTGYCRKKVVDIQDMVKGTD